VSTRSGVREVVSHALLVEPGDVDDLASKVVAVLTRPRLARAMSRGGREEARRLGWGAPASRLLDVYRDAGAPRR
jgi:glycosyltransferase involved in cell wall biosynthesis